VGQPGNPRPRIFRLPEQRALINRMGFPNQGAARARARLRRLRRPLPGSAALGVNLGKNAPTPLADAARDYVAVLEALHDIADYAVVNVSSPNTQGLRSLQERRALESLLAAVVARRDALSKSLVLSPESSAGARRSTADLGPRTQDLGLRTQDLGLPVLVKVAPDLDWRLLAAVVEAVHATGVDGIVATNTTLAREGVSGPRANEVGGLSGEPLRARSTEIVRWLARETGGALPIVGSGGISHPDHALEKLDAGAALVQLYTGLIYEGPTLPARICRAILERRRGG
jgi:dihydroorotate dehydrogenase